MQPFLNNVAWGLFYWQWVTHFSLDTLDWLWVLCLTWLPVEGNIAQKVAPCNISLRPVDYVLLINWLSYFSFPHSPKVKRRRGRPPLARNARNGLTRLDVKKGLHADRTKTKVGLDLGFVCIVRKNIMYAQWDRSLEWWRFFLWFLKNHAHRGCIYLIKNTDKNTNIVKYFLL